MRMMSYAQNQEDVVLDRAFPRGVPGTYIDVGAFDPVLNSVTKHFYDLGWHGINVEPAAAAFARLCAMRDRDVNLNVGLSSEPGVLTLYESPPESGWSTFEADQAAAHRKEGLELLEREVQVRTLRDVCEEFVDGTIDFISIDVEGHEREVLEGGDWDRWRPRVVVVESTRPGTPVMAHDEWEPILLKANYLFVAFDGLNRYYVRAEDADLAPAFVAPANVLDDFLPYRYHKQVEDLRNALAATNRSLAAARATGDTLRAVNEALRAQVLSYRDDIDTVAEQQRRLDALLAQASGRHEWAIAALHETRVLHDQLEAALRALRADMEALTADVGPATLAVTRSLHRTVRKVPGAAVALRVARGVRRRLRAASR